MLGMVAGLRNELHVNKTSCRFSTGATSIRKDAVSEGFAPIEESYISLQSSDFPGDKQKIMLSKSCKECRKEINNYGSHIIMALACSKLRNKLHVNNSQFHYRAIGWSMIPGARSTCTLAYLYSDSTNM